MPKIMKYELVLKELKKRNVVAPLTQLEREAKLYELERFKEMNKIEELEAKNNKAQGTRLNAELHMRKIKDNANKIDKQFSGLNDDEKGEAYRQLFEKEGIGYDPKTRTITMEKGMTFALDGKLKLEPSQFFQNMGWLPVAQRLNKLVKGFPFQDFFAQEMVEHGTQLMFYSDYAEADTLPAYEVPEGAEYVNKLYNPDIAKQFEEQYHTYLDYHKGLKIPSMALNDYTSRADIFLALVNDVAYQIARPIARDLAILKMQMIQNPKNISTGVDWDTLTADFTITYDSGESLVSQIANLVNDLQTTSRSFQPKAWWPEGATQGLEIGLEADKYQLIMDNKLETFLNMYVKAGLFNQDNLKFGVEKKVVSYKNSFENYIKAKTHQDKSLTDGTFYLILASPESAKVITMYEGSRSQELLVFFDVSHSYIRVGDAYNKNYPIFLIKVVAKDGKLPIPPLVAGGTMNIAGGSSGGVDKAYVDAGDAKSLADAEANTTTQITANNAKTFTPNADGSVKYNGTKDIDMNQHKLANVGE